MEGRSRTLAWTSAIVLLCCSRGTAQAAMPAADVSGTMHSWKSQGSLDFWTTHSSVLVDWVSNGFVATQICWRGRGAGQQECHQLYPSQTAHVLTGLQPATAYNVTLTTSLGTKVSFHAITSSTNRYRSLAWQCEGCEEGECIPALKSLVQPLGQPEGAAAARLAVLAHYHPDVDLDYNYTCLCHHHFCPNQTKEPETYDLTNNDSKNTIYLEGQSGEIVLDQAYFVALPDPDHRPACVLPSALAILKYWCQGKPYCEVRYEQLHSFLAAGQVCPHYTVIEDFKLGMRLVGPLSRPWCKPNMTLYGNTCYGYGTDHPTDYDTARLACLLQGGDLAHDMPYIYNEYDAEGDQGYGRYNGHNNENEKVSAVRQMLNKERWCIGNATENRQPRIFSMDRKFYVVNGSLIEYNDSQSRNETKKKWGVCALPPEYTVTPKGHMTSLPRPPACQVNPCLNGGICFHASRALGEASGDWQEQMCRCPSGYSGARCETSTGGAGEQLVEAAGDVYVFSTRDPHTAWHVQFVYFGRNSSINGSFPGCYAPAALALLRLKCEGRSSCHVSRIDLHNHLHSTCHPSVLPSLSVRLSQHAADRWRCPEESVEVAGSCFTARLPGGADPHQHKLACNAVGGDLASLNEEALHVLCSPETYPSADVWNRQAEFMLNTVWLEEPTGDDDDMTFNLDVQSPVNRSCHLPSAPSALCEVPKQLVSPEPSVIMCQESVPFPGKYPHYKWEETSAGHTRIKPCPDRSRGEAAWWCRVSGEWAGLPDLSHCKSFELDHWAYQLTAANGDRTTGKILTQMADNLTTEHMAAGDVSGILDVLHLADARHNQEMNNTDNSQLRYNKTERYMKSLGQVCDMLLADTQVWFGLPQRQRQERSSQYQATLEAGAARMSLLLNDTQLQLHHDAFDMQIEQYSRQHYDALENRIFGNKEEGGQVELAAGFQDVLPDDAAQVSLVFTRFHNLHCVLGHGDVCNRRREDWTKGDRFSSLPGVVNSRVMGLALTNPRLNASNVAVSVTLSHLYPGDLYQVNASSVACVWWDEVSSDWSGEGCTVLTHTAHHTHCSCNHLTNFAVIMDINGVMSQHYDDPVLEWLTYIGCGVSVVCLTVTVVVLSSHLRRKLPRSTLTTTVHLHLCVCLLLSLVVVLGGLDRTESRVACGIIAGLLHYLLLATFCWMAVEGVTVYLLLVKVFQTSQSPHRYFVVAGYGVPLVIVAITAGIKPHSYGTSQFCWLDTQDSIIWAFAGPALLVLLVNLFMFARGLQVLARQRRVEAVLKKDERSTSQRLLRGSFTLTTLLGLTWITGYFYVTEGTWWMAVVFTVLNSLQGALLFVVVVWAQPVHRAHMLTLFSCAKKGTKAGTASESAPMTQITHTAGGREDE